MSTVRALPVHVSFARSRFSRFINSPGGRVFRLVAGAMFLGVGYAYRDHAAGVAEDVPGQTSPIRRSRVVGWAH